MISEKYFVINHGVGGDSIKNISYRYSEIVENTPHKAVIAEGGINDIMGAVIDLRDKEETYSYIIDSYRK